MSFSLLLYFDGAKPGDKRQSQVSIEQRAEGNKKRWKSYEVEKRDERGFHEVWKKDRPWLQFNDGVMTCSLCQVFFKNNTCVGKNTFITGSTNFKVSTVSDHESSKCHQKAAEAELAKQSKHDMQKSEAGKALLSLKSAERHVIASLFRNAHAVAKKGRPLSDYVWLCEAMAAQGVEIGSTYLNEKACSDFVSFISDVETDKTIKMLNDAPFFCFMMDGSQDRSGLEQESLYVRTSLQGNVSERFLTMGSPRSTSSQHLLEFVQNVIQQLGLDETKLVGLGSDGAANMTGKKAGLAALLRKEYGDNIINIHCFSQITAPANKIRSESSRDMKLILIQNKR
ncbi:zinc finger protein 862-like [Dreissena polymorpha]|uniref:zinc finger protein 862-like n=1 Tax=Dreissena polymorpha TaxID=45954 RepID=UPI0022654C58|nr:zinc finger protein 862-like [Dreissena polymorpha]